MFTSHVPPRAIGNESPAHTNAVAITRDIAVNLGTQRAAHDIGTMIVSVDETRGPISPDKVSRLEKSGVIVHRYTTKDVVDANEWMLRERYLAKHYAQNNLGLYLHSEPIVLAARFAKKVIGEPPDFVWVFEDDAFFCGKSHAIPCCRSCTLLILCSIGGVPFTSTIDSSTRCAQVTCPPLSMRIKPSPLIFLRADTFSSTLSSLTQPRIV